MLCSAADETALEKLAQQSHLNKAGNSEVTYPFYTVSLIPNKLIYLFFLQLLFASSPKNRLALGHV